MSPQTAKDKVARFPVELQPNPGYRYELPAVTPEGWVEIDAGMLAYAAAMAVPRKLQGK